MKIQNLLTHLAVNYLASEADPKKQMYKITNDQLNELVSEHGSFINVFDELLTIIKSTKEADKFQFHIEGEDTESTVFEDEYTVRFIKIGYEEAAHRVISAMFRIPADNSDKVSAHFENCKDNTVRERFDNYSTDVKGLRNIFEEKFAVVADELFIVDLVQNESTYRECINLADTCRQTFSQLSFYLQAEGRSCRKGV